MIKSRADVEGDARFVPAIVARLTSWT